MPSSVGAEAMILTSTSVPHGQVIVTVSVRAATGYSS